jgi:enterochelin esterase-like enzyme
VLAFVAVAALAAGVVAGGGRVDQHGARVEHYTVQGRRQVAVVPRGLRDGERRPLLVFLHGRGGVPVDRNLTGAVYAGLARAGARAPVVVVPDGGDHGYWHDRRGKAWGRYVMDGVIPAALKRLPVDPRRVAIGRISMGGFGALDLARLHRGRFASALRAARVPIAVHRWPGGHDGAYWSAHWAAYLRFYATACA